MGRECACESVCFHALGLLCQSSNPVAAYGERPVKDQTRTLSAAAGGWYIYTVRYRLHPLFACEFDTVAHMGSIRVYVEGLLSLHVPV